VLIGAHNAAVEGKLIIPVPGGAVLQVERVPRLLSSLLSMKIRSLDPTAALLQTTAKT
jgi:hypothetical protein